MLPSSCVSPPPAPSAAEHPHARAEQALPSQLDAAPDRAAEVARAGSDGGADAGTDAGSDVDAGSRAAVRVEIERAHKLYERPRPKGAVHAAGHDLEIARWNVGGKGDPDFISNRPSYHPAVRVRVDTRVISGRLPEKAKRERRVLSRESVLAQARKYGYWPLRLCFEEGLRSDQSLRGESVFQLSIATSGRARNARLLRTKLADKSVAECLRERIGSLEFKPAPPARIGIELSVALWPGDAPVLKIGPPKNTVVDNPGELDADAIASALAAIEPRIADCQRRGMDFDPALWGRIQIKVELDAKGRVESSRQDESRFPHRGVARCVVRAVRDATFPPAKGGRITFVVGIRLGTPPPIDAPADADK